MNGSVHREMQCIIEIQTRQLRSELCVRLIAGVWTSCRCGYMSMSLSHRLWPFEKCFLVSAHACLLQTQGKR